MRTNKLSAAIFVILAPWMAGTALADCQADSATAPVDNGNDVIVCDDAVGGPDTNGVNAGNGLDIITVNTGSSVSNTTGDDAVVGGDGADTIVNHGLIQTNGSSGPGESPGDGISDTAGNGTITNTGTIITVGEFAAGIRAVGNDYALLNTSTGSINTTGGRGFQMNGGSSTLTNQGSINTSGASGVASNGVDNTVTNDVGASIVTTGDDANGVVAFHSNNVLDNHGTISTSGDDADGIQADGDSHEIHNTGSITTSGDPITGPAGDETSLTGAQGMELEGSDGVISNDMGGSITTTGRLAHGILAVGDDNTADNFSTIDVDGDSAAGISVVGNDNIARNGGLITGRLIGTFGPAGAGLLVGGDGNTVINSGEIRDFGYGLRVSGDGNSLDNNGIIDNVHVGMSALGTGNTLNNSRSIVTTGFGAGIRTNGDDNHVTNAAGASIITSGINDGIKLAGDGLDRTAASVSNHGSISTSGDDADGIAVQGTNHLIENRGVITTAGGIDPSGDDAIFGYQSGASGIEVVGNDNIVINYSGAAITTSGAGADGMRVTGDDNQFQNHGSIVTSGADANGMRIDGNRVALSGWAGILQGDITTSGTDADGVQMAGNDQSVYVWNAIITTSGTSGGVSGTDASAGMAFGAQGLDIAGNGNGVSIEDGTITTTGAFADGLQFTGNDNNVLMSGSITTAGQNAPGMSAIGDGNHLASQGAIVTGGAGSHGLWIVGNDGDMTNFGSIETTGPLANGMAIQSGNSGAMQSAGSILTSGDQSHGMFARGTDHRVTLFGSITTDGLGADGIHRVGDWNDTSLTPRSTQVTSGASIVTNGNDADAVSVVGDNHLLKVAGSLTTNGTWDRPGTLDASAGRIDGSQGVEVVGDGNRVEALVGATITVNGDDSNGVAVFGNDFVIDNAGTITTLGLRSEAILANRGGGSIRNSGSIVTSGLYSAGVNASGVGVNITVDNAGGSITTSGEDSYGIRLQFGGKTAINSGLIETSGEGANGILVGNIPDGDRNQVVNAAGGRIQTSGLFAYGINYDNATDVENHGEITTTGNDADGIGGNGGFSRIVNGVTGSIVTSGDAARGISVGAFRPANGDSVVNAGTIATTGLDADGIHFEGAGSGMSTASPSIDSSGSIATTGNDADAISAHGNGYVIRNSGTITTQGGVDGADAGNGRQDGAQGIEVAGDDNVVAHSGSIVTSGADAAGIVLLGNDNAASGSAGSSIDTSALRGYGMLALGDGNTLGNASDISTLGGSASGLRASGDRNTLSNSGSIDTAGTSAHAMAAAGNNGTLTNAAGGSIATSGDFGNGLHAFGNDNQVDNQGEIVLSGDGGDGVAVFGTGNVAQNGVGASITTSGQNSNAMLVEGDDDAVVNAGTLITTGLASDGMRISGNVVTALAAGAASVANSGDITTGGDDADGISVVGNAHVIRNSGSITTTGGGSHGIFALGNDNTVINAGSIATVNAAGVLLQGANNALDNSGSITMTGNDAGVRLDSGTTATIVNSGTIDSAAQCVSGAGAGATSLSSSGSMDCGAVAVQLGAAGDSVSLLDSSTTIGNIDLGAGNDSIVLDVDAGLTGRLSGDLLAAESLTKSGDGLFTIDGDAQVGFTSAHINAGTLALNGGTLTGNTYVAAGATLQTANYAFTGNIDNAGTLDSSADSLAIDGNYSQGTSGSLLMYSNVSGSDSTRIEATGSATLDGHVDVSLTDPASLVLGYNDIVLVDAAGGRSGEFVSFNDNIVDSIDTALYYNANQAMLRVTLAPDSDSLLGFGAATAQASSQIGRVLDQRLRVLHRSHQAMVNGDATQTHEGLWGQYYGVETRFDAASPLNEFDADTAGALAGIDFRPATGTMLGVAIGASDTTTVGGTAHGTTQNLQASVYASQEFARGYVEGIAHYSVQEYRIQRRTLFGDIAGSQHDGTAYGLRLAAGVDLRDGITLFDQLAYDHVDQDGYTETGAASFNQTIESDRFESLRNRLGLRFAKLIPGQDASVATPWLELAWLHDFAIDEVQVVSRPASAPGPITVATRETLDDNGLSLRAGVSWLRDDVSFSMQVNHEQRGDLQDWGASVQFGWLLD